jgi:hypothetical protein
MCVLDGSGLLLSCSVDIISQNKWNTLLNAVLIIDLAVIVFIFSHLA